ncbi:hypothetical protein RCO28_18725 [Streptomyces sp. LHD-70]|uniref:hypothetical protein n=1 Tax=Streptomyces sp. LHD-70 TaxID=3072140 RepID=UPI00280F2E56|nr:hypothetical protein [Streptomyces sp. LHD-70]MDQ8704507.1 hypothetical protein [Streptomyces sp. LHD-70]
MDTTASTPPDANPPNNPPELRIDAALQLLASQNSGGSDTPVPALLAILEPSTGALGTDEQPASPPPAVLQERIADHLASCWPRLAHADFSADLASDAMKVVAPVIDQLQRASRSWRQRAVAALIERDEARDIAAALEQLNAEAVRLLRAGGHRASDAIAVLESDGASPEPQAGRNTEATAPEAEHQSAQTPERGRTVDAAQER